jgi:chemotaxis protein MotB
MAPVTEDVPIRIVKKKGGHGGHHGGAWKVAYADFVTAMMALFIVLWIVGQSKEVKAAVTQYFVDPGAFTSGRGGAGPLQGSSPVPSNGISQVEIQRKQLEKMGEDIIKKITEHPELKDISSQVRLELVKEGMRIELVEKSEAFFFDVGTSAIKPEASAILAIIAQQIGQLPNKIVVEGHTDGRPYSRADGYTNFELSSERANSARRILVKNGVSEKKIDEIRGYADTRLRDPEHPYDIINRRISILVKFKEQQ